MLMWKRGAGGVGWVDLDGDEKRDEKERKDEGGFEG
jgi:hypothetical protein